MKHTIRIISEPERTRRREYMAQTIGIILCSAICLSIGYFTIYLFFPQPVPKYQQACTDLLGKKHTLTVQKGLPFAENDPFYICIKETAKLYVERDFPERSYRIPGS